jgi:multiple sugar transport system ATP-binding protein
MNVLKGRLHQLNGRSWIEAQGHQWPVAQVAGGTHDQPVDYGIRPGDISLSATGSGIAARVIVVEPTGADTELLLQVGEQQLVVVLHGRTTARPEDTVYLAIDPAKAHVFDDASGQRLS